MIHPFDTLSVERLRERPSAKWQWFPGDVLPCWVADMDFPPAREIREALADHALEGDFVYPPQTGVPGLLEAVCGRLQERHGLAVEPDQIYPMSGIIPGLYLGCSTLTGPGEGVVVQPPIYPPFMAAVRNSGRQLVLNPMVESDDGWRLDTDGLKGAIEPHTRLLMLCNPQNPTGRMFTRRELEELAEVVLEHRLWVVSDELHADLALNGRHVPFASISPEVAARTVTLYGPTKAFNLAGLKVGFAFSHNGSLLERFRTAGQGLVTAPNVLAQRGAVAAYGQGERWLEGTLEYLRNNRAALEEFVRAEMPGVRVAPGEGTYLAWLDLRGLELGQEAAAYLLERARVGLNAGSDFGAEEAGQSPYSGFVRLNFATSRKILLAALERIRDALKAAA